MNNPTKKKQGGRVKGTPNKVTKELRSVLKEVLYNELESIEDRLDQLEPKQRLEVVIKLMTYVFPRVESTSHTTNEPFDFSFD